MKEIKIVDEIKKAVGPKGKDVVLGIGDDCAALKSGKDKYLLWATDMLVEGTHFSLKKASYASVGRKAVAVNISDIAAMGGVPKYILVNIGVPAKKGEAVVRALYKGINRISKSYGVKVIGGDINRSARLIVDVTIIGMVEKKNLLTRSGAKKGDLVLVTGPIKDGRKHHLNFEPRLNEARYLAGKHKVSAMIDTSDGIAPDLIRICSESGVGCRVYQDAVPLSMGLSVKDALYYGESFELLFTMSSNNARKLYLDIRRRRGPMKYFVIGEITSRRAGMKLIGKEGRVSALKMEGYRHIA